MVTDFLPGQPLSWACHLTIYLSGRSQSPPLSKNTAIVPQMAEKGKMELNSIRLFKMSVWKELVARQPVIAEQRKINKIDGAAVVNIDVVTKVISLITAGIKPVPHEH